MSLQDVTTAVLTVFRCFQRPHCPTCGDSLLVPESSEFVTDGRIRHTWVCDDCGHEFMTGIDLRPRFAL